MDLGLTGRVAIVCGASAGIGFAVARGMAAEGARVLLCARDRERLSTAVKSISQNEPTAELEGLSVDLSLPDSARAVVGLARTRWGRCDVLVTNTGGPPPGQPLDLDDESFRLALEQNFFNVVRLCREAAPLMREGGYGRVVNILSLSVRQLEDNLVLSSTARLAVVAYARYLAEQFAPDGITVNNVLPGSIHTDRMEQVARMQSVRAGRDPALALEHRISRIPMRRLGTPAESASLVLYLASAQAGYVTGQSIAIDGGQSRSLT